MELFHTILDYVLHLDIRLDDLVDQALVLSYFLLFFVTYLETAGIITTFLPSDTVIFTASSLAAVQGSFSPPFLFVLFFAAATLGDSTNFSIGRALRKRVNKTGRVFFIKTESLDKTNKIFEKSKGLSIIFARFVPLLRGLVPFIAGVSTKEYRWFLQRNIIGNLAWVTLYTALGLFFGTLPLVRDNFGLVAIGITVMTICAAAISFVIKKYMLDKKQPKKQRE